MFQNLGCNCLNDLKEFKDDLVFKHEYTNKNLLFYSENQKPFELTDYLGNKYTVTDVSGCSVLPTTYEMKRAELYARLVDESSKRAIYKLK